MKFFKSLPFRLLLGIAIGAIIGVCCRQNPDASAGIMQVIVCVHRLMGQFISFCVPLIVFGFICPSITKLGDNAGKLLGVALILAYVSSILAAAMAAIAGYLIVPNLDIHEVEGALSLPDAIFKLDIPQVMPVITALVLSIALGLAAVWTKAETTKKLLAEFQKIVLAIVEKAVIPMLPFYIGTTFVTLGYDGTLTNFPVFLIAIVIVIVGHFIWMTVLYLIAGAYSGKNPVEVFRHYGPAYITAVGTMSSAATLSVALECANKSKVLRKDLVGFGIPLFANIHLCGSVLTETFFVMLIYKVLTGTLPPASTMILFIVLLGIFAVGAPGVPGGTVVASLGIVTSVICAGNPELEATLPGFLLAIFALQDSFGTACNVTGDGALTLILTGYAEKNGIKEA
ncbi:MAG: dicarboxylate/amino acid:cation symporter [Lachnospiraceae bacterium]|nr:dicarboxylate/amino acid:cation symporter [Lachnospiraceae bacterium]